MLRHAARLIFFNVTAVSRPIFPMTSINIQRVSCFQGYRHDLTTELALWLTVTRKPWAPTATYKALAIALGKGLGENMFEDSLTSSNHQAPKGKDKRNTHLEKT